jgi:uncharacterized protein
MAASDIFANLRTFDFPQRRSEPARVTIGHEEAEKEMTIHSSHALFEEFPDRSEQIRALVLSDASFSHDVQAYDAVNLEILRIENELETASDEYVETLKKKRLLCLDKIQQKLLHPERTGA